METRSDFSRSGLAHIMAVSGMHVGFLIAPFWMIIPWLWQKRAGKSAGLLLVTLLLLLYAGITGFSPSVCRASLMLWLRSEERRVGKEGRTQWGPDADSKKCE